MQFGGGHPYNLRHKVTITPKAGLRIENAAKTRLQLMTSDDSNQGPIPQPDFGPIVTPATFDAGPLFGNSQEEAKILDSFALGGRISLSPDVTQPVQSVHDPPSTPILAHERCSPPFQQYQVPDGGQPPSFRPYLHPPNAWHPYAYAPYATNHHYTQTQAPYAPPHMGQVAANQFPPTNSRHPSQQPNSRQGSYAPPYMGQVAANQFPPTNSRHPSQQPSSRQGSRQPPSRHPSLQLPGQKGSLMLTHPALYPAENLAPSAAQALPPPAVLPALPAVHGETLLLLPKPTPKPSPSGRPNVEVTAAIEKTFATIDHAFKRLSDQTGRSLPSLRARWNSTHARTNRRSAWNSYQGYYAQCRDEESRKHLEYVSLHLETSFPTDKAEMSLSGEVLINSLHRSADLLPQAPSVPLPSAGRLFHIAIRNGRIFSAFSTRPA